MVKIIFTDMKEYRGEIIDRYGNEWLYDGYLWPNFGLLTDYIDAKLDGRKYELITEKKSIWTT